MDEMTAFESQVAREAMREAGPSRPVEVESIVRAATTTSPPGSWHVVTRRLRAGLPTPMEGGLTMLSALKYIAAAAIVALFGGFLLVGILSMQQGDQVAPAAVTESPSPMTTEALLSGMVTEEVEPGVYRVIDDGVRDLVPIDAVDIVAGYDGGIWLLREDGFRRLGSDGSHAWPADVTPADHVFEVAPDGTMWVIPKKSAYPGMRRGEGRRSTDGDEWTAQPCPTSCKGVSVAPDGTLWATWRDEPSSKWRVGYLGPTDWQPLDGYVPDNGSATGLERLFVTAAGDLYGVRCVWACSLHRYEDGGWTLLRPNAYMLVDVGSDGTVWRDGIGGYDLARLAGGDWTGWRSTDLPDIQFGFGLDGQFQVAPDGSLWFSGWRSADGSAPRDEDASVWEGLMGAVADGRLVCDGLARFDGDTLDRFLPGQCISMDVAADGSVWVLAVEEEGKNLYVITPEAVATTE